MRCLNCGEAFDGTKKACHACGTKVAEEIPAKPTPVLVLPSAEKPAEKPKKAKEKVKI